MPTSIRPSSTTSLAGRTADPRGVRLHGAVSTSASSTERSAARRSVRNEGLPLPVLVLAIAALGVLCAAVPGIAVEGAVGRRVALILTSHSSLTALRLSFGARPGRPLLSFLFGVPLAWLLARVEFPGEAWRERCARFRWCSHPSSPASRCSTRSVGAALSASTSIAGSASRCRLRRRADRRSDFRGDAVPGVDRRGGVPSAGHTVRGGGEDTRRLPRYVFRRVTVPAIRPGLIVGAVLAWARGREFGATITFAGNFPGRTQTMPLAIYIANEVKPDEAIVLSLVLIAVSFGVLVGLRDRFLGSGQAPNP